MKIKKIVAVTCSTMLVASLGCGAAFAAGSSSGNTVPDTIKKGQIIKADADGDASSANVSQYKATSTSTLSYSKTVSKTVKTVSIPAKIGKFKVTGIVSKAFKGTKVKTIKVKATKISAKAMKKAVKNSKVKTIKVKSSMYKAYKKVFKNSGIKISKL